MDGKRFDDVMRTAASRRGLLSGGLAVATAWFVVPGVDAKAKGKGKGKKRKGKAKPNEFGCLDVGDPCKNAGQCCSGICQGKKGKKRCQAHDAGDCRAGITPNACAATGVGQDVACTTSGFTGLCFTTTGNAGYCAAPASGVCHDCARDVECQALLGPGAACVRCPECAGSAACLAPPGL